MTSFAPSRLLLARQRRRMTAREFADKLGIVPLTVSRLEAGKSTGPSEETLQKIIEVTGFPRAFFFAEDLDPGTCETVSFRSLAAMKARERDAALAAIPLACLLDDWLTARFNIPTPDLVDLSDVQDPDRAAITLRRHWGLGEQPIASMVRLLESKGVRTFSLAEDTMNVDAFSCWRGDVPFVFLNTMKTAERGRFDSAHELGHLVLHRHKGTADDPAAEDQANKFASAFLLPHTGVSAHVGRVSSIDPLIPVKKHWGVSLAALVYRLHKLGRLSDWQNRMLCVQMSRRGYRSSEPDGLPREESSVWKAVLESLWKEGITKGHIAKELNLPLIEVENLISGLVAPTHEKSPPSIGTKQGLRLVP